MARLRRPHTDALHALRRWREKHADRPDLKERVKIEGAARRRRSSAIARNDARVTS